MSGKAGQPKTNTAAGLFGGGLGELIPRVRIQLNETL